MKKLILSLLCVSFFLFPFHTRTFCSIPTIAAIAASSFGALAVLSAWKNKDRLVAGFGGLAVGSMLVAPAVAQYYQNQPIFCDISHTVATVLGAVFLIGGLGNILNLRNQTHPDAR